MTKNNTRNHKGFMKKLSAGLMASLCALSVIGSSGTNIGITASAAMTTENTASPLLMRSLLRQLHFLALHMAGVLRDIQVCIIRTAILRFPLTMSDSRALTVPVFCTTHLHIWATAQSDFHGTILFLWILRTGCQ